LNKEEFLKSLDNVYCRLKTSPLGIGVFAIRDIPNGTNPFKGCYDGEFIPIPEEEIKKLDKGRQSIIVDFCPYVKGEYWVPEDGIGVIDVSFYLNHSKEPNMNEDGEGLNFYANRDIKEGEELTVDYLTYNDVSDLDPINYGG
jgi:SET domain-containing protein